MNDNDSIPKSPAPHEIADNATSPVEVAPHTNARDEVSSDEVASDEVAKAHDAKAPIVELKAVASSAVASNAAELATARENESAAKTNDEDVEQQMRQMSRRSFLWGAVAVGLGYGSWNWLSTRRTENGIPWPARRVLETNEQLARDFFNPNRMAPTFARSQVTDLRVNGDYGLPEDFDPKTWSLMVTGLASGEPMTLSIADLKKLPRAEMTTELKCIEGWSAITHWAGARFSDFAALVKPQTQSGESPDIRKNAGGLVGYVSLSTPDKGYYVGLEMASALHPQTLLCYEMNGKPLPFEHGAPLRLITPLKYGIKNIKRIGQIQFMKQRPADYWAERGYDWYAGH